MVAYYLLSGKNANRRLLMSAIDASRRKATRRRMPTAPIFQHRRPPCIILKIIALTKANGAIYQAAVDAQAAIAIVRRAEQNQK